MTDVLYEYANHHDINELIHCCKTSYIYSRNKEFLSFLEIIHSQFYSDMSYHFVKILKIKIPTYDNLITTIYVFQFIADEKKINDTVINYDRNNPCYYNTDESFNDTELNTLIMRNKIIKEFDEQYYRLGKSNWVYYLTIQLRNNEIYDMTKDVVYLPIFRSIRMIDLRGLNDSILIIKLAKCIIADNKFYSAAKMIEMPQYKNLVSYIRYKYPHLLE